LACPVIYLLSGGSTFWNVPAWAAIAFCPGFLTGHLTFDLFESASIGQKVGTVVGCLTVSLCYGLVAWLLCIIAADCKIIPKEQR